MSDPRYPAMFQRPASGTGPAGGVSSPRTEAPAAAVPAAAPSAVIGPRASARPGPAGGRDRPGDHRRRDAHHRHEVRPRHGNRIVLLGAETGGDDATSAPLPRRNLALAGLSAAAAVLLALALLGGWWSQGLLRGAETWSWGFSPNPDGLYDVELGTGTGENRLALSRLLVQLAPTTLALGVLALLVAIVLPVLARRPR